LVMDKKKEKVSCRSNWWSCLVYLWNYPTLQPANFVRVYAAYGGMFIVFYILWGLWIDKKKPDRYEIIGSFIVLAGAAMIYYAPSSI
jgi:drug/metabolite transporter superfamily protein YnfA